MKIILAAGGTGGHTIPALSFARELSDEFDVTVISDERGMKNLSVPDKVILNLLSLKFFQKRGAVFKFLGITELLLHTFLTILKFLKNRPAYVVGFGGFPSFPAICAAFILRIPYGLHEQNAILGRVNRLFAKHASKVFTSFKDTKNAPLSSLHIGNPIRKEFLNPPLPISKSHEKINILIMGGSQGASVFANTIPNGIKLLPQSIKDQIFIYQQTRPADQQKVQDIYVHMNIKNQTSTFFSNVPELMNTADLIITRAGASTVFEIMALNKKALLVPYPFAVDNHQFINAQNFIKMGYGWMCEDKDFTPDFFASWIQDILQNKEQWCIEKSKTKPITANLKKMKQEIKTTILEKLT